MATLKTETEMFPLVESWLSSGLTQKEFSCQHQIPAHVLVYWIGKYRKVHGPTSRQTPGEGVSTARRTVSFIRLSTATPSVHGMEVQLPTGVVIRFASPVPVAYLQQLLKVCSP